MIEQFFTRLSHWIQRTFGPTSYQQAAHCAIAVAVISLLRGADYFFPGLLSDESGSPTVFIALAISLMWGFLAVMLEAVNRIFLSSPDAIPFTVPPSIVLTIIRGWTFGVFLGNLWMTAQLYTTGMAGHVEFLYPVGAFTVFCFNYLAYIVPLPPGQSKVKEWLQSFKAAPQPASSEA